MTRERRLARGFTLVEILVSLAMLGIVSAGTAIYLANLEKSRYRMEAIATRDAVGLRLKRLTTLSILEYSAKTFNADPGNAALQACLSGPKCTVTNPLQPMSFNLAYPRSGSVIRFAGSDQSPVIYCHDGREKTEKMPCAAEWEARAYFVALCPFGYGECERATAIRVSHKLENKVLKDQPLLDSLGLKDETSGVFTTIQVPQGPKQTPNPCNPRSVITKVDKDGKVDCTCLPGMKDLGLNPTNHQPECQPEFDECKPPLVTIGYGSNFEKRCASPAQAREIKSLAQKCDGFITDVLLSGCITPNPSGGGGKGKGGKGGGGGSGAPVCGVEQQTCVRPTPQ